MRVIFLACLALAFVAAERFIEGPELLTYSYAEYLKDFNKVYDTPEALALHEARFHETLAKVLRHNADKTKTWKEGINKFSDMTDEEFKTYLGFNMRMSASMRGNLKKSLPTENLGAIPTDVDWRTAGIVTPVKDQGQCGSCWAFATAETVESSLAINTGSLVTLSPQDVVSCAPNPDHCGGTGGCSGATAEIGFTYVANSGIASDADWPYTATNGVCNTTAKKTATGTGYVKLIENNGTDLLYAVANPKIGPIAVSVDASTWSRYVGGIFNGCSVSSPDINHAVQLVGYGTDSTLGMDYWLVRNSWGPTWGEKGYIRLYRGEKEGCGIDTTPEDGSGCTGGPPTVEVCGTCGIWYDTSYPTGVKFV